MRERLYLGRRSLALNATCTALASSADHAELERRSLERLPKLGIRSLMVVVYDATDAGAAHVLCGYDAGGTALASGQSFDRGLIQPSAPSTIDSGSLVVLPLFFRDRNMGHVLLDLDLRQAFAYGALAEALSVGLHAVYLASASVSAQ
jgi:hypothetical protein